VIEVKDSSFTPATLEAHVGDTISWVNLGKIAHTVTAKDHAFDKTLKPGQRFNLVLAKEGTIPYVCTPHPGMFGVLIVGPALTGAKAEPPLTLAGICHRSPWPAWALVGCSSSPCSPPRSCAAGSPPAPPWPDGADTSAQGTGHDHPTHRQG